MQEKDKLRNLRLSYERDQLIESNISKDPFVQFTLWFDFALKAEIFEPNAMTIATAAKNGIPSARVVLLKEYDETGFTLVIMEAGKGKNFQKIHLHLYFFGGKSLKDKSESKAKLRRSVEKNLKIILM